MYIYIYTHNNSNTNNTHIIIINIIMQESRVEANAINYCAVASACRN